ncbi:MAG: DNA-processing protein DprA [Lachnospiraceae bacterium]|nr:DNA-processing protein DprA [Lachnospiraceae bacterium]
MSKKDIEDIIWLKDKQKKAMYDDGAKDGAERLFEVFEKGKVKITTIDDCDYPKKLKNIYDPPYALYYIGENVFDNKKIISVVGARMCDEYGRTYALKIARALAENGCVIVSGMAYGIDAAAHWGALKGCGKTIAVLGNGPDIIYPEKNALLYNEIIDNGCAVSEYFPKTAPKPGLFPQRNRIISGLSDAVILIEAKEKSGSLITADLALDQGKDIYALPGRVDDALSAGTNALIKQGAGIITDIESLLKDLNLDCKSSIDKDSPKEKYLEKEELMLYSVLDLHEKNLEIIYKEANLEREAALNALSSLIKKGYVTECFKNYYRRI